MDPDNVVRTSLPHRTHSDEFNGNLLTDSNVVGQDPEKDTSKTNTAATVPHNHLPTSVPASLRKPLPVPRKPRKAVLVRQEKVEEVGVDGRESQEVKESTDRKSQPSLSINAPVSPLSTPAGVDAEPVLLSSRKPCPPPAPPPRKRPLLSAPEKPTPATPAPPPPSKDTEEQELAWEEGIYEMECSVDEEDEPDKNTTGQEDNVYDDVAQYSPSTSTGGELDRHSTPALAAHGHSVGYDGNITTVPKKPQRNSNLSLWMSKKEMLEGAAAAEEQSTVWLDKLMKNGAPKDKAKRELPSTPEEKRVRSFIFKPGSLRSPGVTTETVTPPKAFRHSLGTQRAKSLSTADLHRSEGQKRNSLRKFLDLKLSVKMLPKLLAKSGQALDCTALETEQSVDGDQDGACSQELLGEQVCKERKSSCPQFGLWVEQSVDGEDFHLGLEHSADYENMPVYEEIKEYMNVPVESAVSPQPAQQLAYQGFLCDDDDDEDDDENIYEEQEPYVPLGNHADLHDSGSERGSDEDEVARLDNGPSDDDTAHSSDEDGHDSSFSSKEGPEQTEVWETNSGLKKTKIHHIATEIMSSESVFVDVLKLLHVDFREAVAKGSGPGGKPVIEERHLNQILYYLPQLYELNHDLLRELQDRVAKWDENAQLADIFVKKGPYLKMYSTYIREFDKNVALLDEQCKKNPAFASVVRDFEASPRCANLALRHYLLKPVQRIPLYQLLLTDYLKNLPTDSADYIDTKAALGIVKEVANHANDIMKQGDNFQKLIQVQGRLNGHHEIVQPGRVFLKEGILMKLSRKVMQPRMFFLFNDTLLYSTPVQSGQHKFNNMLPLAGMKVSKPSQEANQNELSIESVERSFILSANCSAERDGWVEAISKAINDYTRKKITFTSNKSPEQIEQVDSDSEAPLGSKAPIWIPDPRATMCMICTCEFTLTWRRHHCRGCGKVVCQSCSSNKYCLEYLKNQLARVCDQCFLILQEQKSDQALSPTISPGLKSTFGFSRKQKKIPAALKEVTANTDNSSMSGYLQRSKGTKKQGKRLWFVIKNKVLYTYAASEDVAALESQPMLGFMLKEESNQKLQFKLFHKKTLYYMFKADDLQSAQRWVHTFKEATVL
ncbi:FYVE, RhoGEF and PH domain-containing protein 6-like [Aplochiton taeniatus]